MALARCPLEPVLRLRKVDHDPFAEPISLAEVKRGIRITGFRQRSPDGDGASRIALLPCIDSGAHGLRRNRACKDSNRQTHQQLTHFNLVIGSVLTLAVLWNREQGRACINQFLGALLSGDVKYDVSAKG